MLLSFFLIYSFLHFVVHPALVQASTPGSESGIFESPDTKERSSCNQQEPLSFTVLRPLIYQLLFLYGRILLVRHLLELLPG